MLRFLAAAFLSGLAVCAALAQGGGGSVLPQGVIVPGNCTKFGTTKFFVTDAGSCSGLGPAAGNPTASVSISPVNGIATTYMRSDAAPALDQTAAYAFSGLGNTTFAGNISFNPTATFDIGTSVGSKPRDVYLSRNLFIGNNAQVTNGGLFYFNGRSEIRSPADASIGFRNAAETNEVILSWPASATLQLGAADVNGAPVAQTIKFQSPLAGSATNTAGANATLIGSLGTGTGVGGDFIFQTNVKTSTGTAQGTPTTVLTLKAEAGTAPTAGVLVGAGGNSAPQMWFNPNSGNAVGFGMANGGSQLIVFSNNSGITGSSNQVASFNAASFSGVSGYAFAWTNNSSNAVTTQDLLLTRGAPATLQLGAANAASPVAQTLQAQSVVAGTSNTAGQNWTVQGSLSTGGASGGDIIFKTTGTGAAATSQNSALEAFRLTGGTNNPKFRTSSTGVGAQTFTNSPCTGLTTEQWLSVEISGQSGTWFVPACQ